MPLGRGGSHDLCNILESYDYISEDDINRIISSTQVVVYDGYSMFKIKKKERKYLKKLLNKKVRLDILIQLKDIGFYGVTEGFSEFK